MRDAMTQSELSAVEADWGGPPEEGEHSASEEAEVSGPATVRTGERGCLETPEYRPDAADIHDRPAPEDSRPRRMAADPDPRRSSLRQLAERYLALAEELGRVSLQLGEAGKELLGAFSAAPGDYPLLLGSAVIDLDGRGGLAVRAGTRLD